MDVRQETIALRISSPTACLRRILLLFNYIKILAVWPVAMGTHHGTREMVGRRYCECVRGVAEAGV